MAFIQASNLAEQACLPAEVATHLEQAYENVMNMDIHNKEIIACLQAELDNHNQRLEQLQAQQSSHLTQTASPERSSLNIGTFSSLSDHAHKKLPADPQLARTRATNMDRSGNGPFKRHVSILDPPNVEEIVVLPL
ncbi:hypothetical protein H2248_001561 [Termitomyces sp. 'cryptogamus']|nr:hypothetical protein H2248_001561 [Termitomyces sp. 'cryptogamus']